MMSMAAFTSFILAFCAIYQAKELQNKSHYTSTHGQGGLFDFLSFFGVAAVGAVGLHPDFGKQKTNQTLRYAHKMASRATIGLALFLCYTGLDKLTDDQFTMNAAGASFASLAVLLWT